MFENFNHIYYKSCLFYMVRKTMAQQEFCQECNQKHASLETPKKSLTGHDCREVYRQLGKAEGRSVVFKVVIAFLVPLVVFIAALAASEKILAKTINTKELQTALSFLLALSMAFAVVLVIKAINKKLSKNK